MNQAPIAGFEQMPQMNDLQHPDLGNKPAEIAGTDYFGFCRSDVLRHVPAAAKRVLSVGCGAGATEAVLTARGVDVVGIELNPAAAQRARSRGLTILEGDATKIMSQLTGQWFDCLIYADVLEHIADPVALLRSNLTLLKQRGTVIISVPNFRHGSVLWQLFIRGHIRYADAGILDRTHLRMTTRRMVEQWYREVGLRLVGVTYRMSQRREKLLSTCSFRILREFVARQVILVGEKN